MIRGPHQIKFVGHLQAFQSTTVYLDLGARLRGRTATQRSKKGSEKVLGRVLGRVLGKGFSEGVLRKAVSRKVPRTPP